MLKQKWRLAFEIFFFLSLAAGILVAVNEVTNPYNAKADKVQKNLYSDDADMEQTEVALIGGSHAVNGFNPTVIWRNERIKSYNFSFSGEPVYLTYYYLKELLEKHQYKLVVFDLYYIGMKNRYFKRESFVFDVLRCMKWSPVKREFIRQCVPADQRKKYYLPLLAYHTRWSELTKADFLRQPDTKDDFWLGSEYYYERCGAEPVSFEPWADPGEVASMPEYSEWYLRKVVELVQSHGSELLFVDLPHRYNDANAPDTWVEDEYRTYNHAKQIAQEYGIHMVQFDGRIQEQIGFIPEQDMYNKGHMNIYGSEKVSAYLGEYIRENYEVTQYPSGAHDLWDEYLETYESVYQEKKQPLLER